MALPSSAEGAGLHGRGVSGPVVRWVYYGVHVQRGPWSEGRMKVEQVDVRSLPPGTPTFDTEEEARQAGRRALAGPLPLEDW